MRRRSRNGAALLAAALLLTALASCQKRGTEAQSGGPGEPDGAEIPSPSALTLPTEAAAAETVSPIPPPQAVPTPKETPEPEADTPPPADNPSASPEATPAPPPEESPPPEKTPPREEPEPSGEPEIPEGKTWLPDGSGGTVTLAAGLQEYDGYTYYFREDGSIAAHEVISLNGSDYVFDDLGRWVSPLRAAVEASAAAKKTGQLVLVVDHNLTFWEAAEDGSWRLRMDTYCGYGGNGLVEADARVMGTRTTPIGVFPLTLAFGTGPNPGTGMTYRQITETSYWSAEDDDTYNTWVESEEPLSGEHLIDYYQYKYAVNIGFNLDPPVHSRGCAIFLHCKSTNSWHTAGCVSLAEEDMLALLLALRDGAYMIIVPDAEALSAY